MSGPASSQQLLQATLLYWQQAPVAAVVRALRGDAHWPSHDLQDRFVSETAKVDQAVAPPGAYRYQVFRTVARQLESTTATLAGDMVEAICDAALAAEVPCKVLHTARANSFSHKTFIFGDGDANFSVRVGLQFVDVGLSLWPSGLYLVAFLARCISCEGAGQLPKVSFLPAGHGELSIVELGCGVGLTAAIIKHPLWSRIVRRLLLTDYTDDVVENCAHNVHAVNGIPADRVSAVQLDWCDTLRCSQLLSQWRSELVLAADVLYDPEIIPALANTLRLALQANRAAKVVIVQTYRNESTMELFFERIKDFASCVTLVSPDTGAEVIPAADVVAGFYVDMANLIAVYLLEAL